jgi:hypothetical protein
MANLHTGCVTPLHLCVLWSYDVPDALKAGVQVRHDLVDASHDKHSLGAKHLADHPISGAIYVEQLAILRQDIRTRKEELALKSEPIHPTTSLIGDLPSIHGFRHRSGERVDDNSAVLLQVLYHPQLPNGD